MHIWILFFFSFPFLLFFSYLKSDSGDLERESMGFESISKALGFVYDQNFNGGWDEFKCIEGKHKDLV